MNFLRAGIALPKGDQMKLGQLLKELREKAGLCQRQVAHGLGYGTPQFVSNWERGASNPPVTALKKLCRLYKTDANEVFELFLKETLAKTEADLRKTFARSK